jgi:hypothetical protein
MSSDGGRRFLRAVRLDASDTQVFERAAVPGEWAVPGAFAFWDTNPKQLTGKAKQAFRNGFLGTQSLGWSTLVEVDAISDDELDGVLRSLSEYFVSHWGAPDYDSARKVALEEVEFAASLCDKPIHTLLAMTRDLESEGVVENFRVVPPPSALDHSQVRIWGIDDSED